MDLLAYGYPNIQASEVSIPNKVGMEPLHLDLELGLCMFRPKDLGLNN